MKPLKDYSFVRGVHMGGPSMPLELQFDVCKRLNLNSARSFYDYSFYKRNPETEPARLKEQVRNYYEHGITTMQILWNANFLDPKILEPEFWAAEGDEYIRTIVLALKDEPGLLMWDIMNEPSCNDYMRKAPEGEYEARWAKMHAFLKHYCDLVKELDPEGTITIGHTYAHELEPSAEWVDVLCFHDYLETRARIEHTYDVAEELSKKYGKPIMNSEMCCLCRANPYDLAIQIAMERHVGFYVFNLCADGYWGDVHGLVYPDGTVRDPAAVAALMGFFRNRGAHRIPANPNKEGNVKTALDLIREALSDDTTLFFNTKKSSEELLEAAEYAANLLEGCELVPMNEPPTALIADWRRMPEAERPLKEIRKFTYELGMKLKEVCQII